MTIPSIRSRGVIVSNPRPPVALRQPQALVFGNNQPERGKHRLFPYLFAALGGMLLAAPAVQAKSPFSSPVVQAAQVTSEAETAQKALQQLLSNVKQATDWRINATPQGTELSCRIDGTRYTMQKRITDKVQAGPEGKEQFINEYRLLVSETGPETSAYMLPEGQFIQSIASIEAVAFPKIEAKLGLGRGLDCSGTVADLAAKALKGQLALKAVRDMFDFNAGESLRADGALRATFADGTQVTYMEKAFVDFIFKKLERFVKIEKPGEPPQVISLTSDSEKDAADLLKQVHKLLRAEEEMQTAKEKLAQEIENFQASRSGR